MKYKIESGVEIPKKGKRGKAVVYPFSEMKVGDSFIYKEYSRTNMTFISSAARSWKRNNHSDWQFSCHKTEDNMIRIWRIK